MIWKQPAGMLLQELYIFCRMRNGLGIDNCERSPCIFTRIFDSCTFVTEIQLRTRVHYCRVYFRVPSWIRVSCEPGYMSVYVCLAAEYLGTKLFFFFEVGGCRVSERRLCCYFRCFRTRSLPPILPVILLPLRGPRVWKERGLGRKKILLCRSLFAFPFRHYFRFERRGKFYKNGLL